MENNIGIPTLKNITEDIIAIQKKTKTSYVIVNILDIIDTVIIVPRIKYSFKESSFKNSSSGLSFVELFISSPPLYQSYF